MHINQYLICDIVQRAVAVRTRHNASQRQTAATERT